MFGSVKVLYVNLILGFVPISIDIRISSVVSASQLGQNAFERLKIAFHAMNSLMHLRKILFDHGAFEASRLNERKLVRDLLNAFLDESDVFVDADDTSKDGILRRAQTLAYHQQAAA